MLETEKDFAQKGNRLGEVKANEKGSKGGRAYIKKKARVRPWPCFRSRTVKSWGKGSRACAVEQTSRERGRTRLLLREPAGERPSIRGGRTRGKKGGCRPELGMGSGAMRER